MSFCMIFAATSDYSARERLRQADAPAAVKALVELALARLPWPQHSPSTDAKSSSNSVAMGSVPRMPQLIAVHVEAHGHIEEGGGGRSWMDRFVVQPLYD